MKLRFKSAPHRSHTSAAEALGQHRHVHRAGSKAADDAFLVARPAALPIYLVDFTRLGEGTPRLSALRAVAWRHFFFDGKRLCSVDVANAGRGVGAIGRCSYGKLNGRLLQAVERARAIIAEGSYEVRVLIAPPLAHSVVWLKSDRHRSDKIIPVRTIMRAVRPMIVGPAGEFFDALRAATDALIAHSEAMSAQGTSSH